MTQRRLDIAAMKREGVTPINCTSCGVTLATQDMSGNVLFLNENAHSFAPKGCIYLNCACGSAHKWRPTRGPKSPAKPTISVQAIKKA